MKHGFKLAMMGASALALSACGTKETSQPKTENVDATCYYTAPSNNNKGMFQVRDNKDGHILFVAQLTDATKDATFNGIVTKENPYGQFFSTSVYEWSDDITKYPNQKLFDSALSGYTTGNKECSLMISTRQLTKNFTGGVSINTGQFKGRMSQNGDPEHWYMYDVADGKPLPKATFAPAGENAIDVPKSQRTPKDPAP